MEDDKSVESKDDGSLKRGSTGSLKYLSWSLLAK